MTILAFLQNSWFKDPEKAKEVFARHPELRNDLIARFLFAGCLTGRRLMTAFGEELCDRIIWEEASANIGDKSSARFQADHDHIKRAIIKHDPNVILAFGQVASTEVEVVAEGLKREYGISIPVMTAPHPAARKNPMSALREVAERLKEKS